VLSAQAKPALLEQITEFAEAMPEVLTKASVEQTVATLKYQTNQ